MTEDQLEQEALGWLASVGYTALNARDLDNLDARLERNHNREVVLASCLRSAIKRLNPAVPAVAQEDALSQILNMGGESTPAPTPRQKRGHLPGRETRATSHIPVA